MSVPGKVSGLLILKRKLSTVKRVLCEEQAGFKRGTSY